MSRAYYNENDPFAAAWLRELIADNLIAPGEVDERSIEDVRPDELAGYCQCHFFAGIGIWSLAFRQAGWPDDQPVWTGSCPCQPFSAAGKGGGFADERHLWPAFHWLIEQSNPAIVLGEQVASKDGLAWLDLVSADLEAAGYAFGAVDTCAAGFGAPHIRQRLYWMADATRKLDDRSGDAGTGRRIEHSDGSSLGSVADAVGSGQSRSGRSGGAQDERAPERGLHGGVDDTASARHERALGDTEGNSRDETRLRLPDTGCAESGVGNAEGCRHSRQSLRAYREPTIGAAQASQSSDRPGPLNGLWRDADWLCCTDGKWRPVAPGTFPLAPAGTVRNRVGTLRGAGNAINLAQAQAFVEAVIEISA